LLSNKDDKLLYGAFEFGLLLDRPSRFILLKMIKRTRGILRVLDLSPPPTDAFRGTPLLNHLALHSYSLISFRLN
jgi:hypothetical protein